MIEEQKEKINDFISDICELCPQLMKCMKVDLDEHNWYCDSIFNNLVNQLAAAWERIAELKNNQ